MKKLLILSISLTLISNSFSLTNCDISENYEDFITIEKARYNDKEYLIKRVVEATNNACFSELVNNNLAYIDHLLTNFSSILKNYKGKEFSMNKEFGNSLKELYKVNLGIDPEEKLLRAQGAMYFLMRNNNNLKLMIKSEYERNKNYLPFVLAGT
ncbi:MAG: hypothetical protein WD426_17285 [Anditalea sp.]